MDTGGSSHAREVVVSLSAQMMLTNKVIHLGISSVLFVLDMCVVVRDVVNYRFVSMEIWTGLGSPTIVTSSGKKV